MLCLKFKFMKFIKNNFGITVYSIHFVIENDKPNYKGKMGKGIFLEIG